MKPKPGIAVFVVLQTLSATAVADSGGVAGPSPNGPDIIVSTIGSTLSLMGTVDVDAGPSVVYVSAYVFGRTTCNLGDADAVWIDCISGGPSCNQHPVGGAALYRLKDGRFEQLGQAWLKHEYCAADGGPSCAPSGIYEPNGSCDWLGPGATETGSASLWGQQSNLGPKSEVNPWTGEFPYPYVIAWQQSGDSVYKRLQVRASDLNPALNAGALYFAEGQTICTDEQPNNRFNNVSYRRVLTGAPAGGGWNLSFIGSTVQQEPAIMAWAANDPGVEISAVDVPDDGRFFIGSKVADRGHGTWRYEYAVYNMNSDRAAGSFTVPTAAGAEIFNVGFHDVDYHSGDPLWPTDWPPIIEDGTVSWRTDDYATTPRANALRWGTLYNFRFDATSAPTPGQVLIGLFKPGATDSVSVSILVPGGPPCAGLLLADANCDGSVDFFDVDPFLTALFDNQAYLANAAWCGNNCNADVNRDGRVDFFDVDPFLACVFNGCR